MPTPATMRQYAPRRSVGWRFRGVARFSCRQARESAALGEVLTAEPRMSTGSAAGGSAIVAGDRTHEAPRVNELVIHNARVMTCDPSRLGVGIIDHGAIVMSGAAVRWVGHDGDRPHADREIDAGGR